MIKLIDEQFFEKIKFWKIHKCLTQFVWEFQIFKFLKELVDSEHILEKVKFWKNYKYFDPFCMGEEIFKFSNFSNCKILGIFQKNVKNICPSLTDKYFLQVKNICPFVRQT